MKAPHMDASIASQPVLVSAGQPGHGRTGAPNAATASTAQNASDPKVYFGRVLARIEAAKRYPDEAREAGTSGAAIVRFALGPDGGLTSVTLVRSSGQASVDRGALAAVNNAAPFEPPPTDIAKPIWLEVRVRFDLQTVEERE
jgi:periplasmic protein TonB